MKHFIKIIKSAIFGIIGGLIFSLLFYPIMSLIFLGKAFPSGFGYMIVNPFFAGRRTLPWGGIDYWIFSFVCWAFVGIFFGYLVPWVFKNNRFGLTVSTVIGFAITLPVYIITYDALEWESIYASLAFKQQYSIEPYSQPPYFRWYLEIPAGFILVAFVIIWLIAFTYYKVQTKKLNRQLLNRNKSD